MPFIPGIFKMLERSVSVVRGFRLDEKLNPRDAEFFHRFEKEINFSPVSLLYF